jgi:hypothetical protein
VSVLIGLKRGVVTSGLVFGVALVLAIGAWHSLSFPQKVPAAAHESAKSEYCIYFPISDRFYSDAGALTLLTMEKSTNAYQSRHAILVWEREGTLRTAYWSFGRERFVRGYQYGVHPVPADMEAWFRGCLAGKV